MLTFGCQKNNLPNECNIQDFDETAYENADYPTIRDALQKYNLENFMCYKIPAFEMLKTPEKQGLYEPAVYKMAETCSSFNALNKYVADSHPDRILGDFCITFRLYIQNQIDDFLRGRESPIDQTKIPSKCRSYATSAERNVCYETLLAELVEEYIFEGYVRTLLDESIFINEKPAFTEKLRSGLRSIKALYQAVSDNQAFIDHQMEACYLELIDCIHELLLYYDNGLSFE